jgi:hypothetical protein
MSSVMRATDRVTPRALLHRTMIPVELTSHELSLLVGLLEDRAVQAADRSDQVDFADYLFRRVAELREAFR